MKSLLNILRYLRDDSSSDTGYHSLTYYVERLADEDPQLVLRVVRSLFEQKVAELRNYNLLGKEAPDIRGLADVWPFFLEEHFREPSSVIEIESPAVDMSINPILACPWNHYSHLTALMHHGKGRDMGAWRQDSNHLVVWYEPIKIGFVVNGMHSITMGVLNREGIIVPNETYDISEVLMRYEVQGKSYVCLDSKKRYPVTDDIWSSIFTAGRYMVLASHR